MKNLISVYITTQNRPMLLQRALISLLQQTYRNFEVLVCNDASDEKYRSEYERVINRFQNS
ncbi:glycosyltransferase family 2 protein, partial [Escherichia coli]|nr:glycosyltransferase family 2 protein [Escherichia coli]